MQTSKYRKWEAIVDDDDFTLITRLGDGAYGQILGGGCQWRANGSKYQERPRKIEVGKGRRRFLWFREKRSGIFFFSHIRPFQCQPTSRTDGARRKWEEDRTKVEKLKASRRFKLYWMQVAFPCTCCISHFDFTAQKKTQLLNSKHECITLQVGCERGFICQSKKFPKYLEWIILIWFI